MDIVLGSVIYNQALHYIEDFLYSLKCQTTQDFDIVLINDNIEEGIWESKFNMYISFFGNRLKVIRMNELNAKPYQLRIELIKHIKEYNYELLVMCDCDDKCAINRIEASREAYCDSEIYFLYNEIVGFDNKRIMPSMPNITDTFTQIQECNYLGLTNTTLVMSKISNSFIKSLDEGKTKVFDWYLFSRILLEGGVGKRVENTKTFYRIYQNNLAGISNNTLSELSKELEVKKRHYELLKKYNVVYEELIRKYNNINLNDYLKREKKVSYWWGQLI